jgi:hypothetical protein
MADPLASLRLEGLGGGSGKGGGGTHPLFYQKGCFWY